METKLVIHCIGLDGLTNTVSGADHGIPLTTDASRVTMLLGSVEYTLPQLPVNYDLADLSGNLTISDSSARTLYRWRLHPTTQSSVAEHSLARSRPTYQLDRKDALHPFQLHHLIARLRHHPLADVRTSSIITTMPFRTYGPWQKTQTIYNKSLFTTRSANYHL